MKKIFLLILMLTIGLTVYGCGQPEANNYFTWWIPEGEDSIYYSGYNDNPVVKYLLQQQYGGKSIDVDFVVPPSGEASSHITRAISTGEYYDVIDVSTLNMSVNELYDEGIALDITDYVNDYMPNYVNFLNENPSLKSTAMNLVDGEQKYLQIWAYQEDIQMWGGWNYRRDWIVEYGENSTTGIAFTGGYDSEGLWSDDVVFPSGGTDPIYISDWEWMLSIFKEAIIDLGITDGYPMQLYYPGYLETGDLVTSFGGGGPMWYTDTNGDIQFGMNSEGFRTYVQTMNHWFDNGWIDPYFTDKASQMFYEIDKDKVYQGKVGLWWGMVSGLDSQMRSDANSLTENINVWGARQPINDIYGSDNVKFKTPTVLYQTTPDMRSFIITDKIEEKDIELLFTFLDNMYSDEVAIMNVFGLTGEQYAEIDSDLFEMFNISETGSYVEYEINGTTYYGPPTVDDDGNPISLPQSAIDAFRGSRLAGLASNGLKHFTEPWVITHGMDEYVAYDSDGTIQRAMIGQLTVEKYQTYTELLGNIRAFGARYVPQMIKGDIDPYSDPQWNNFLNALDNVNKNFTYEDVIQYFEELLNQLVD